MGHARTKNGMHDQQICSCHRVEVSLPLKTPEVMYANEQTSQPISQIKSTNWVFVMILSTQREMVAKRSPDLLECTACSMGADLLEQRSKASPEGSKPLAGG
jgi:hypothetical protein